MYFSTDTARFKVFNWSWFYLSDKSILMIEKLTEFILNVVLYYKYVEGYNLFSTITYRTFPCYFVTGSPECVWGGVGTVQQYPRVRCETLLMKAFLKHIVTLRCIFSFFKRYIQLLCLIYSIPLHYLDAVFTKIHVVLLFFVSGNRPRTKVNCCTKKMETILKRTGRKER